ncbi:MAG: hypothetical protein ACI814_004059, partial [Mariniblastus sp.]
MNLDHQESWLLINQKLNRGKQWDIQSGSEIMWMGTFKG